MAKGQYTAADLAPAPQQQNSQAGQYSAADLASSAVSEPQQLGALSRFATSARQTYPEGNPLTGIPEAVGHIIAHPMDSIQRVGQSIVDDKNARAAEYDKAGDFFKRGQISQALAHSVYGSIPFLGPGMGKAATQLENEDYAGGTGTMAGIGSQFLLPKVAGKIGSGMAAATERVSAPLRDTMTRPRGITPPEAATPAELKTYADQNNLPVNAAQVTEHSFPRSLQTAGERSTVGGTAVRQQINNAGSAISQHATDLMDRMAPGIRDVTEAGNALRGGIETALEREKQVANQNYANIDRQARNVQVDLKPVKQLAGKLLSDNQFIRENAKTLDPKRGSAVLNDMTKLPDQGTFSQAQQLRSRLLDEARHPENAISQDAQGWMKMLTGEVDGQMMTAAQRFNNPALEQQFRDANAHWKGLEENFNNPRSPLFQTLQEYDPAKIAQKFHARGQIGGSPNPIKTLQQYGIDTAPLKRAVLEDIAGRDFRMQGHTLAGYSDDFLRTLFNPEELDGVYKTSALARSVGRNVNPSGTSGAMQAEAELHHPMRGTLNTWYANRTNSPGFNQWMMRTQPGSIARGVAAAARVPQRVAPAGTVAAVMGGRPERRSDQR